MDIVVGTPCSRVSGGVLMFSDDVKSSPGCLRAALSSIAECTGVPGVVPAAEPGVWVTQRRDDVIPRASGDVTCSGDVETSVRLVNDAEVTCTSLNYNVKCQTVSEH